MTKEDAKVFSFIGYIVGFTVFISMFFFKNVAVWFSLFLLSVAIIGASNYLYYSHFPEELKNTPNTNSSDDFMDDDLDEISNVMLGGLNTDDDSDDYYDNLLNDD